MDSLLAPRYAADALRPEPAGNRKQWRADKAKRRHGQRLLRTAVAGLERKVAELEREFAAAARTLSPSTD